MKLLNNKLDYLGVLAFGVKGGVILPGDDISQVVVEILNKPFLDGLIDNGDVICVTESVVARSQNNYVTVDEIVEEIRVKLEIKDSDNLGVLFPILSRNRFSLLLKGIARAVKRGGVILQLSFPCDEVGNRLITEDTLIELGKNHESIITREEIVGKNLNHPITGINYLELYENIIRVEGAKVKIVLANNPLEILSLNPKGIIISNIHNRFETKSKLLKKFDNLLTLQDLFNSPREGGWSEWGLLGSNLSYPEKVKLPPREGNLLAETIQKNIFEKYHKFVEVIIYGDGAYKDPVSGIYELADPQPAFGTTKGIKDKWRIGVKYKYLADVLHKEGKTRMEIERYLEEKKNSLEGRPTPSHDELGTTPRRAEDLLSSLADLVSGSADAATPVVVIKNFN